MGCFCLVGGFIIYQVVLNNGFFEFAITAYFTFVWSSSV